MRIFDSLQTQLYRRPRFFPSGAPMLDGRQDVAAAFSLRRLRANYSGPFVRIRRSSDSTEQDFGVGYAWLDWNAISAFIGAGNAFATTLYDQSGNSRDLTQSTAANQPQVINAANGRPALLFDGGNDNMKTAGFTVAQPWSFNLVYRRVSVVQTGQEYVFDGITGDRIVLAHNITGTAADNALYAGTAFINSDDGTSMAPGVRGVVGGALSGAASRLEVNATTVASFTGNPGTNGINGLTLGTYGGVLTPTLSSNVEVQEWVCFSTAHSQAQLQADNAAMRSAWGF